MTNPVLQKALVIVPMILLSVTNGILFGQMTGMVRALRNKEDGISLTDNEISIMTSTVTIMTNVGIGMVAVVTDRVGRRRSVMMFAAIIILNWIILYQAKEMYMFMLSRVCGGIGFGAIYALYIVTTSEYTSPKTRAFYLHTVITVGSAVGTGLGHVLGLILHWRTVALIGIFPGAFGMIVPYFWVESPYWLATKGRFEECEQAFWELHTKNSNTKAELHWLIKVEKNKLEKANLTNSRPTLKRLFLAFRRKYFWELVLLSTFMYIYIAASGKLIFSVFATVILEDITGTPDVLLYTLLVDAFFIVGSCISLVLVRNMSIRTLIFVTGFVANSILVTLSICLYFKIGQDIRWINVTLIGAYFIILNSGPFPSIEALLGEIFPLELKVYCFCITGLLLSVLLALSLYLFPFVVSYIGYHNFFLLKAALMTVCLGFMWFRLPETKGRTLQEIEVYFKTKIFDVDQALSSEEMKSFI